MQGYLQTAGAEHYPSKYDATTGETVFVYLVHVYNEQKKRKHTALTLKGFVLMPLTRTQTSDYLYNDLIAANS